MKIIDLHILFFFTMLPLLAAFFISLVPKNDLNSKIGISKFFAALIVLTFFRLGFLLSSNKFQMGQIASFGFIGVPLKINLFVNGLTLSLLFISLVVLVTAIFSDSIFRPKVGTFQASPFILIFFLFFAFGQREFQVALTTLTIGNFLVYWLIAFTTKERRGSAIFHLGIFLLAIDSLALVIYLILPEKVSFYNWAVVQQVVLLPGLVRLFIPMFAPFAKKVIHNIDESQGPFLAPYFHLSGLFLLLLARDIIPSMPKSLSIFLSLLIVSGIIYLSSRTITEHRISSLPYYILVFFSSISLFGLLFSNDVFVNAYSISLILSAILCFLFSSQVALLIEDGGSQVKNFSYLRAVWFLSMAMNVGIPGLGVGFSLWGLAFHNMKNFYLTIQNFQGAILALYIILLFSLLGLFVAVIVSVRVKVSPLGLDKAFTKTKFFSGWLFLYALFTALLSWLLPFLTLSLLNTKPVF